MHHTVEGDFNMKFSTWVLSVITSTAVVFFVRFEHFWTPVYFHKVITWSRFDNPFQIHILTWNRPDSFKRLLKSLINSSYGGDYVDLIIHIDGGEKELKKCSQRQLQIQFNGRMETNLFYDQKLTWVWQCHGLGHGDRTF